MPCLSNKFYKGKHTHNAPTTNTKKKKKVNTIKHKNFTIYFGQKTQKWQSTIPGSKKVFICVVWK